MGAEKKIKQKSICKQYCYFCNLYKYFRGYLEKNPPDNEFQYIKAEINTYVHSLSKNNTNKLLQNEKKIDWTDTVWLIPFITWSCLTIL